MSEKSTTAQNQEAVAIGNVGGIVEDISIHKQKNIFKLHISFPSRAYVECIFPQELLEKVKESLNSFVSISGECFYRPEAAFPYKVNVREIEILPQSENPTTLEDLRGIAPNATGDKSSEQFVREMRNEWDKRLDRWRK